MRYSGPAATQPLSAMTRLALQNSKLPLPVMLYLLGVVLPIGFNIGPLAMTTLRLLLVVMAVPLLAGLLRGKYGRVFATDILFVAHLLWIFASLAVNNPNQVIQQIGSVGVEFIGGYLIGRAYIRDAESFAALCRWMVFLVLCSTPFALFEAKTGRPLIIEALRAAHLSAVAIVSIESRMGLERVQAVFAHPIHYGLFCSVAFSLAFVALRDVTSNVWRYTCGVIIALSGFLALSSGALLAIILQIALILWATIYARIHWRWWLLVGHFVLAYIIIDIFSTRTPLRVFMSYATFSAHNAYWRSIIFEWGMKNLWGSPLFGIGLHDWVRPAFMHSGSMDNFWLVMGVRYGIPGFVTIACGYALMIYGIMRRDFEQNPVLARIRRAWVFTFLGLSFTLTTVHVWANIYSFVFFMFGAGVWLRLAKAEPETPASTGTPPGTSTPTPTGQAQKPPQTGTKYSRFAPRQRSLASPAGDKTTASSDKVTNDPS